MNNKFLLILLFVILIADDGMIRCKKQKSAHQKAKDYAIFKEKDVNVERQSNYKGIIVSKIYENIVFFIPFILLYGISYLTPSILEKIRKYEQDQYIKQKFKSLSQRNKIIRYTFEKSPNQRYINWFMRQKWKVKLGLKGNQNQEQFKIKFQNIKKIIEHQYQFEAQGYQQELKGSKIKGMLVFQKNSVSLIFKKTYNNQKTRNCFKTSLFEGCQLGQQFKGQWCIVRQYSGEKHPWRLIHQ